MPAMDNKQLFSPGTVSAVTETCFMPVAVSNPCLREKKQHCITPCVPPAVVLLPWKPRIRTLLMRLPTIAAVRSGVQRVLVAPVSTTNSTYLAPEGQVVLMPCCHALFILSVNSTVGPSPATSPEHHGPGSTLDACRTAHVMGLSTPITHVIIAASRIAMIVLPESPSCDEEAGTTGKVAGLRPCLDESTILSLLEPVICSRAVPFHRGQNCHMIPPKAWASQVVPPEDFIRSATEVDPFSDSEFRRG